MRALYKCRFIILKKSVFSRYGRNEIPKILKTRFSTFFLLSSSALRNRFSPLPPSPSSPIRFTIFIWQVAWAYPKFGSLLASHSDGILLQHILLGDSTTKEIEKFETDLKTMHPSLTECRVLKSKLELSVIQYANGISSEAHIEEPKPKKQSAPTAKIGSNKKPVSKPVSSSDESEFESESSDDSDSSDEEEAPKKPAAVAKNGAAAATKKAK
ncbi:unnamed protein product [Lactuca saligna]|uniref:Uncharacterized protein n=1 Tax=Lactuca saligna TaxID=75948 RepID=A0AA35VUR8_LACSI|nr:unnamed protein product [Lactuca saligna]